MCQIQLETPAPPVSILCDGGLHLKTSELPHKWKNYYKENKERSKQKGRSERKNERKKKQVRKKTNVTNIWIILFIIFTWFIQTKKGCLKSRYIIFAIPIFWLGIKRVNLNKVSYFSQYFVFLLNWSFISLL